MLNAKAYHLGTGDMVYVLEGLKKKVGESEEFYFVVSYVNAQDGHDIGWICEKKAIEFRMENPIIIPLEG